VIGNTREDLYALTLDLCRIPSVSGSPRGENDLALRIAEHLSDLPYFRTHPEDLRLLPPWATPLPTPPPNPPHHPPPHPPPPPPRRAAGTSSPCCGPPGPPPGRSSCRGTRTWWMWTSAVP
jgi:hypothetical protein